MKKRIALFANGWTTENLTTFTNGLKQGLPDNSIDIYIFLCYNSFGMAALDRKSEGMIYKLPVLSTFDAAVVFGPGLNFLDDINAIYSSIDEAGIPAISIGQTHKDITCISVDNRSGMKELCDHVILKHAAKKIVYIAGSMDNDDSNTRLEVIRESMKAHGYNFDSKDVYYSNWEVKLCRDIVHEIVSDRDNLPDAIMCANDSLAMHTILTLTEAGIKVPDEIIVTGFDNLSEGQNYYPAITTVDQCYDEVGKCCSKYLLSIFEGKNPPAFTTIDSHLVSKESCGCTEFDGDSIRRAYAQTRPYSAQKNYGISGRLFSLEQAILKSQSYIELAGNLKNIFTNNTGSEGSTFYMMLDPIFENIGKEIAFPQYTYSDIFNVATGKHDTIPTTATTVTRKSLIPESDLAEENKTYIFLSLYYESFSCGYMVFEDALAGIQDSDLFLFNNRINRILLFLKRNLQLTDLNNKLSELMDQDALTRVKNRTAYDKYLKRLEADFIEGENKPFAVIYFDINNLKMVNDMYGHEKGDAYIKNSCRLICNTFKHSPVFRIGGDEFVSIAQNDDFDNRHELLNQMREHMKALKIKGDSVPLTERISIASGMAEYDRTLDEDFASIFKRADELMYENKYNMKNPV